jgi:RES domain-containing protein
LTRVYRIPRKRYAKAPFDGEGAYRYGGRWSSPGALPATWRQTPALAELAAIGDRFARRRREAILVVPSALAPDEFNWLLNPEHPDFRRVRILPTEPFSYDARSFV